MLAPLCHRLKSFGIERTLHGGMHGAGPSSGAACSASRERLPPGAQCGLGGEEWLRGAGRTAALIRQISNPMASTDCTMLALAGTGHAGGRTFGFASCNRAVGASEGMNVLMRRRSRRPGGAAAGKGAWEYEYGVTNVEYTEFQRLGIDDVATEAGGTESCFPANTNILYVGAPSLAYLFVLHSTSPTLVAFHTPC